MARGQTAVTSSVVQLAPVVSHSVSQPLGMASSPRGGPGTTAASKVVVVVVVTWTRSQFLIVHVHRCKHHQHHNDDNNDNAGQQPAAAAVRPQQERVQLASLAASANCDAQRSSSPPIKDTACARE
eukprot:m.123750 g.123750  ORF g.123750 m.123750 type:complete len:126 (+) comp16600_c0_seq5:807-1184(+)